MEVGLYDSVGYVWPEIALLATAIVVALLAGIERLDRAAVGELAVLGASVSVFFAARLAGWGEVWIFGRSLVVDGFAVYFKIFIGVATVAALWISLESPASGGDAGRASALVLGAASGLDLMASASSLWSCYLAVEIACLALWRLASTNPATSPRSSQLGAAVVSVAMLCGVAWIAGFSRSTDYERVHEVLSRVVLRHPLPLTLAAGALLAGFPSRVWLTASARESKVAPAVDVFVAVAFTAAGVALSIRLLFPVISTPGDGGRWAHAAGLDWTRLLSVAAVAAMTIGNLGALREQSLRRLLVAAAVAQLGYAILGMTLASDEGVRATLFYVAAFTVAALGAFHLAAVIERSRGTDDLSACHGLLRGRSAVIGVAFAVFLLSLAGMPSLVGFPAKLHVLGAVLSEGLGTLGVAALVNCVASLFAFGRVLRAFARRKADAPTIAITAYDASLTVSLVSATIFFGVHESPLFDLAGRSIDFLPR